MSWIVKVLLFAGFCTQFETMAQQPKLILQAGNTGRINLMGITADTKYLANAYGSESIHLWEVSRANILNTYRHDGRVTALAFSPDKSHLLAGTTTGSIYGWKYAGEENHFQFTAHAGGVNDFAISTDGTMLVSCGADTVITIWNIGDQSLKTSFSDNYNPFQTIALDPEKPLLYAGDRFGNLLIYNYESEIEEYYGKILPAGIRDITIVKNRKTLLLAGADGSIYNVGTEPVDVKQDVRAFENTVFSISVDEELVVATGRDPVSNPQLYAYDNKNSLVIEAQDFIAQDNRNQNFEYGIYAHARSAKIAAIPNEKNEIVIYDLVERKALRTLKGLATPVRTIAFFDDKLLFTTGQFIGKHDLLGLFPMEKQPTAHPIDQLFRLSDHAFSGYSSSGILYSIDPVKMKISQRKVISPLTSETEFEFLEDRNLLVYKYNERKVYVEHRVTGKKKPLKIDRCRQIKKSKDNSTIAVLTGSNEIKLYRSGLKPDLLRAFKDQRIRTFALSEDGNSLAYLSENTGRKSIELVSVKTKERHSIPLNDTTTVDEMMFSPDGRNLFTYARSVGKFNQKEDYDILCWNVQSRQLMSRLAGHNGFVNHLTFNPTGEWLLSAGMDGTIRFWSVKSLSERLLIIPFTNGQWVALTPEGRFDASPEALPEIHFMFKNERLPLDQMKQHFYEPKLADKILGYLDKPFLTDISNNRYTLYPKIEFLSDPNINGVLAIGLKDLGGGIGRVSVSINNKEAVEDVRELASYDTATDQFTYKIQNHPFLKVGELNLITVEAYNAVGYKISNKRQVYFIDKREKLTTGTSNLYALIIGISDYAGDELDLNFAAKDALDFTKALRLGAEEFLGKEKVHIYSLNTTEGAMQPTVKNIRNAFEEVASQAEPNDILLVYLAGHGMDLEEDEDFHFLTMEAEKRLVEPADSIEKVSISTTELGKMIKRIPALKQLLIVDACHSGNLLNSSFHQQGELNAESIKALEFLKDRTGTFVLASSEGEDVSYESTILNQGLLTYSLLFGLKGAGLYEGELIDATNLMNYALRKVPALAEDIGQSQQPVIKMPPGLSSFQFGRLPTRKRQEILLDPPKPVVIRSHFHKTETLYDEEHVSEQLDEKIRKLRNHISRKYIFLDENHFTNAYSVYGHYHHEKDGSYEISYKIFKNERPVFESEVESFNLDQALDEITRKLVNVISRDQQ